MSNRLISMIASGTVIAFVLSGCGGGGSSSSGGGGGGGGGVSRPSISLLSPSVVMTGLPIGEIFVYGSGFTDRSLVLIDGVPVIQAVLVAPDTLQAQTDVSLFATADKHQVSVQNGGQTSNAVTLTVYAPKQGPFAMQAMPAFAVGGNITSVIVSADVNGDGLADAIMTGPPLSNSESIAILYGQTGGLLSPPQYIPVPLMPWALAVGDLDGNGTADLVSVTNEAGSSNSTVSILSGDGHGNFQAPVIQQTFPGVFPGPAYLADLDGDGQLDLVLSVEQPAVGSWSLVWLKNTGGSFAAPVTLASTSSHGFSVADFNVDGKPDIVYEAAGPPHAMHILVNQGGGTFHDQVIGGLNGVVGVTNVLDFNLDGIPDLVVEASSSTLNQLYSFKGNGDGSFTQIAVLAIPPVNQLVTGDFDHDGFPDLAGAGPAEPFEMMYFFGDGHGNFVAQAVVGPAGQYAAVGDFNGDGIPDVVEPDGYGFVSLSLGRTNRNFPSPVALSPATMTNVSAGDINGDGLPEILVAGDAINNISATVFLNQGNHSFQLAAYTNPYTGILADLTGKGVADMLGGPVESLEIWPNNGTLDFSASPFTIPNSGGGPFTVADMDGDGCPDIVTPLGQVFYGNCAYQFTPVTLSNSGWGPYVVGDFNGDGKLDIATGLGTFLNTGGRTFQQVATNGLPFSNGAVGLAGDFNGDGKDDIAVNVPGDSSIGIYYSKGDGTFYLATVLNDPGGPGEMVVGDFDGDGRVDLAVGLLGSEQLCILFNAGGGEFTMSLFASGASTVAMTASDLNRDGKPDLVLGNFVFDAAAANVNVVFHK